MFETTGNLHGSLGMVEHFMELAGALTADM
jgi:hypothetical protein